MRSLLLGLAAALAIPAAPATAQSLAGAGFTAGPAFASTGSGVTSRGIGSASSSMTGVTVHHGDRGDWGESGHGRHRGNRDGGFGGFYPGLRDGYDINQGWASDSYNDWWHDRPDRAYPRWMSDNQDCKRLWWSGGGWRC